MKGVKYFILGFIVAVILLVAGYSLIMQFDSTMAKNYDAGYREGLLHTQKTGSIVYLDNSSGQIKIKEMGITDACNNMIQQQLNNAGGK